MSGVVILETMRRHFTSIGYWSFVAFVTIVAAGVSQFNQPSAVWPSLITLLAIITGCNPIGPEFSSGTLQLVLVKPINRATYLLSRVTGVVLSVWLAALCAFAAEAVGRMISGEVPWSTLAAALLNSAADAILTVSLLTLLGSLTRAYFNVALYLGLTISISFFSGVLRMVKAMPEFVFQALAAIERNLYPDVVARFDSHWLLLVLSNAAVALLLACFAFRNTEVPYGAD
jgi:ABC-type transport system involved in multi-copper enzyme maturation permease subunit